MKYHTSCKRFQILKLVEIQRFHEISGSLYEISSELWTPWRHTSMKNTVQGVCLEQGWQTKLIIIIQHKAKPSTLDRAYNWVSCKEKAELSGYDIWIC